MRLSYNKTVVDTASAQFAVKLTEACIPLSGIVVPAVASNMLMHMESVHGTSAMVLICVNVNGLPQNILANCRVECDPLVDEWCSGQCSIKYGDEITHFYCHLQQDGTILAAPVETKVSLITAN